MEPIIRTDKQLAAALRRYRRLTKLTQSELASTTGKRQATISNLEAGGGTLDTLFAVLSALELELVLRPRGQTRSPPLGDLF